jgi:hypothetical protein
MTPAGECRHALLSRIFDDECVEPCRDRCDACRTENIAEAAVHGFEKMKLRMEDDVMQDPSENAGAEDNSSDCGI